MKRREVVLQGAAGLLAILLGTAAAGTGAIRAISAARLEGASFSPDGERIVYQLLHLAGWPAETFFSSFDPVMYVENPYGGKSPRQIGQGLHPQWSPTRDEIAFVSDGNLWLCRSDGSDRHQILDHLSVPPDPTDSSRCMRNATYHAWSPDGGSIAFILSGCADEAIAMVQRDGGGARTLLEGLGRVRSLTWSPAHILAFVEDVPTGGDSPGGVVKLLNPATAKVTAIPTRGTKLASVTALAFAPSGKLIAATAELVDTGWQHTLWELLPDGSYLSFLDPKGLAALGLSLRGGTIDQLAFAPKVSKIMVGTFIGHGESDLWVIDLPPALLGLTHRNRATESKQPGQGD